MSYFILILVIFTCILLIVRYNRRPPEKKKKEEPFDMKDLQERKLACEVRKLEGELNNRSFESFFKKYTGPVILVLGFACAVLAYFTQIKDYVANINRNEKVQYTEIQIAAIEKLGDPDPWVQKTGVRILEKMELDAVDILLDRLNGLPTNEKKSFIENIHISLDRIYKKVRQTGSNDDLEDFNRQVNQSSRKAIHDYKKNFSDGSLADPVYNNVDLVEYLINQNSNEEDFRKMQTEFSDSLKNLNEVDPVVDHFKRIYNEPLK